jgi:hypothetical protein
MSTQAETCKTSGDMDPATQAGIVSAAQSYFTMAASGDTANLKLASVASDSAAIEAAVKDHGSEIMGSHAQPRPAFLLEADGSAPVAHAEFFCGVFNRRGQTADSAVFHLNDLAPGKYAAVILDVTSSNPGTVSFLLQQAGTSWKVVGLYFASAQAAGHSADWFVTRARDYKAKKQLHNAWLYYLEARILISPLPFMQTRANDDLIDESQPLQPADFPHNGQTVDLSAGNAAYPLITVFPEAVGKDLDLIVKYQVRDVSNTGVAYQSNLAVIQALMAKFPELKDAFDGVVARAVEPSGRDYGTLLRRNEIK